MAYSVMSLGDFLLRHGGSLEPFRVNLEHRFVFGEPSPALEVVEAVFGCRGCKRDLPLRDGLFLLWVDGGGAFIGPFCARCDPPTVFLTSRLGLSSGSELTMVKTKAYKLPSVRVMLGDLFADLWPEPQDPLAYFG